MISIGQLEKSLLLELVLISVLIWFMVLALSLAFFQRKPNDARLRAVSFATMCLAISVLGGTVGTITGMSRTSIAGDVIPAALVFLGIGASYVFSKDMQRGFIVALLTIAFSASFLYFSFISASVRKDAELASELSELLNQEVRIMTEECASLVLSTEFLVAPPADRKRIILYCRSYLPFLR